MGREVMALWVWRRDLRDDVGTCRREKDQLGFFALRGREGEIGATFPYRPRKERFCGLHGCVCFGSSKLSISCSDSSSKFMPSNILALSKDTLSSIRHFTRASTILLHCTTAKNIDNSTTSTSNNYTLLVHPLQFATMTKRTKSKPSLPSLPYQHLALRGLLIHPTEVGVTGKYGTRSLHPPSSLPPLLCPPPLPQYPIPKSLIPTSHTPSPPSTLTNNGCARKQIRRLPPQTGEEDGNLPTRPLHLHLLRQDDGQAAQRRYLELQELQEDGRGGSVDGFVSLALSVPVGSCWFFLFVCLCVCLFLGWA